MAWRWAYGVIDASIVHLPRALLAAALPAGDCRAAGRHAAHQNTGQRGERLATGTVQSCACAAAAATQLDAPPAAAASPAEHLRAAALRCNLPRRRQHNAAVTAGERRCTVTREAGRYTALRTGVAQAVYKHRPLHPIPPTCRNAAPPRECVLRLLLSSQICSPGEGPPSGASDAATSARCFTSQCARLSQAAGWSATPANMSCGWKPGLTGGAQTIITPSCLSILNLSQNSDTQRAASAASHLLF